MISKLKNVAVGASDMGIEKVILIQRRNHGGGGSPLCSKCDVIFSYIYTNTTKLGLHLFYLVRLD